MKPRLSRRMFLRTASSTIALPFLQSALPRSARADDEAPRRMVFWYTPNGIPLGRWTPTTTGPGWYEADLPYVLSPLGELAKKTTVVSGLMNDPNHGGVAGGDHARGTGSYLTCHAIKYTAGDDISNSTSVDQIAAQATSGATPFPSFQIGLEEVGTTGDCSAGYSCAYMRNLAWANETTPLPNIIDPQIAFRLLFPSAAAGMSPEEAARRRLNQGNVLADAAQSVKTLMSRLGSEDSQKLDQYLTAVEEVQDRLNGLGALCEDAEAPPLTGGDVTATADAMSDILALAMQCDLTRIATFMLANSQSNRSYNFIGVPDDHHQISHHLCDPAKIAQLETIANWEVARLAYFLGALDKLVDVDGRTMLDNSLVYFSSEIQDGNSHSHADLPVLYAGSLGDRLVTGSHLQFGELDDWTFPETESDPGCDPKTSDDSPNMSDLFVAFLQAFGTPVETFGDSTGVLDGVLTGNDTGGETG